MGFYNMLFNLVEQLLVLVRFKLREGTDHTTLLAIEFVRKALVNFAELAVDFRALYPGCKPFPFFGKGFGKCCKTFVEAGKSRNCNRRIGQKRQCKNGGYNRQGISRQNIDQPDNGRVQDFYKNDGKDPENHGAEQTDPSVYVEFSF